MSTGQQVPLRRPRRVRWWTAVLAVFVVAAVECVVWTAADHGRPTHTGHASGSCVVVTAPSPDAELRAVAAPCDTDPSFTVAGFANQAGDCASRAYTRFRPPFSDDATGRLCLVPNLVVGHCYRFAVPVGMWQLVACAGSGPAVVRVTKRIEAEDQHACPADTSPPTPGIRRLSAPQAMPYPSRTYCFDLQHGR